MGGCKDVSKEGKQKGGYEGGIKSIKGRTNTTNTRLYRSHNTRLILNKFMGTLVYGGASL